MSGSRQLQSSTRIALAVWLTTAGVATPPAAGRPRTVAKAEHPGSQSASQAELQEVRRLLGAGDAREAADRLERRLHAAPEDVEALLLLGTARALLAQPSASLEAFRRAAALQPDSAAVHHAHCMALGRFGDMAAARAACEAAVRADPSFAPARLTLGLVLASEEDAAAAERQFTAAIEGAGDVATRAQASYLRGRLRRELARPGEALPDLERAVELQPRLAPAQLELGRARADSGDDAGAIEALGRAVELDPDDFDGRYYLGTEYLRAGQAALAVPQLRAAAKMRPDDRDVAYSLGRALRASGAAEEASQLLSGLARESQGRAVEDAEVREAGRLNNEGIELEAKGDHEAALARFRAAAAIEPDEPRFLKNVGLALCRLGRWAEAKAELREALRLSPGDPDAQKALYLALEHAPDDDTSGKPDSVPR